MAPAERTCAPVIHTHLRSHNSQPRAFRRALRGAPCASRLFLFTARTVEAKETDGECRVWAQDGEEDGEGEDARRDPCHRVAVLRNLRLERGESRLHHRQVVGPPGNSCVFAGCDDVARGLLFIPA